MMRKWLKHLDISKGLQICFLISALLSLFVGAVGLYTWEQQNSDIRLAIGEGFPKVQAAFQAEEQINLLNNGFISLTYAQNTAELMEWKNRTELRLNALKDTIVELEDNLDEDLPLLAHNLSLLLDYLSNNVAERLTNTELLNQTLAKINWLHDDFHNEFTALLQEMSWQQSALINTFQTNSPDAKQFEILSKRQQDLQLIYSFITYEDQIVTELKKQIVARHAYSDSLQKNYLIYLKLLVENKIKQLTIHSSTYIIKQIIDELIVIGLQEDQLPALLINHQRIENEQAQKLAQMDAVLSELRSSIREQVGNSQKQLQMIQNIVEKGTRISGMVILISMLVAFIFLIAVNFFYIRLRLLKRFQLLNQAVDRLNNGESQVRIPVHGIDELGRIAQLLRSFLYEMNKKNTELESRNTILINEITDRIRIQNELVTTQNELIQAAKLAVVGRTLTSISHEINQPLNALNAYVFSAKKALTNHDTEAVAQYFDKISHIINRTTLIIKRLHQFSRKGTGKLEPINLLECIHSALSLLESKRKSSQAEIIYPAKFPLVLGEDVLIQQVFVNIILNSIEAQSGSAPYIEIQIADISSQYITLFISDNGKGWPLTEQLLQPFSSSKSVNLGLGLSICTSIMKQCDGELYIASTLDKHALIILKLRIANNV